MIKIEIPVRVTVGDREFSVGMVEFHPDDRPQDILRKIADILYRQADMKFRGGCEK